jgi:hypothetical protein
VATQLDVAYSGDVIGPGTEQRPNYVLALSIVLSQYAAMDTEEMESIAPLYALAIVLTSVHVWHQKRVIAKMGGLETNVQKVRFTIIAKSLLMMTLQILMSVTLEYVTTAQTPLVHSSAPVLMASLSPRARLVLVSGDSFHTWHDC